MKPSIDLHCVIIGVFFLLILCHYTKSSIDLHCVIIKLFLTFIVSLCHYFSNDIVSLYEIIH